MSTSFTSKTGTRILTSLDFNTANKLVSDYHRTGKGRLSRRPDGCIETTNSLWVEYGDTHTDLHDINDLFRIKDRIAFLYKNRKDRNRPFVIVDWGCGAGHTLTQLDAWLRKQNITDVRLYGFANEIHPDWWKASENITFILDVAENLPAYFLNGTVDFIYSIAGLYYLFLPEHSDCDYDMEEYFRANGFDGRLFRVYPRTEKHLEELGLVMDMNGELMIDLPVHIIDIDYDLLKIENNNCITIRNPKKYGEHAYVVVPG